MIRTFTAQFQGNEFLFLLVFSIPVILFKLRLDFKLSGLKSQVFLSITIYGAAKSNGMSPFFSDSEFYSSTWLVGCHW